MVDGPAAGAASAASSSSSDGPLSENLDISSQQQLQKACYDKAGLCMLVLLDGQADEVDLHKQTTKKVAAALADAPVHWVAVDVSKQRSFMRAFGFEADQLPGVVALSTKRMRLARSAAPFGEEAARQLVNKVLAGSAVTVPVAVRSVVLQEDIEIVHRRSLISFMIEQKCMAAGAIAAAVASYSFALHPCIRCWMYA